MAWGLLPAAGFACAIAAGADPALAPPGECAQAERELAASPLEEPPGGVAGTARGLFDAAAVSAGAALAQPGALALPGPGSGPAELPPFEASSGGLPRLAAEPSVPDFLDQAGLGASALVGSGGSSSNPGAAGACE